MITETASAFTTERISRLREKILSARPTICTERALIYTEAYKKHENEPVILKRAYALRDTLLKMSVYIDDGELLAGNQASAVRAAPIFPEYVTSWILKELDEFDKRPGDAFYVTEDQKSLLRELLKWWEGKTLIERGYELMSPLNREIHDAGIIRAEGNLTSGDAHIAVNYQKILRIGLSGYLSEITEAAKLINEDAGDAARKLDFYKSLGIGIIALSDFIRRYAVVAEKMAAVETNPERKEELMQISMNCRNIASGPPSGFWEALQLTWFVQLVLQIESNGHSVSLGRMDQYLYPFYKNDVAEGRITEDKALELLENMWLKLLSVNKIRSWSHTRFSAGGPLYQNVTVGGQTTDGKDAVNELSFLILDSVGRMRLTQPNLSVRFHKNINPEFLRRCIDVIGKDSECRHSTTMR